MLFEIKSVQRQYCVRCGRRVKFCPFLSSCFANAVEEEIFQNLLPCKAGVQTLKFFRYSGISVSEYFKLSKKFNITDILLRSRVWDLRCISQYAYKSH